MDIIGSEGGKDGAWMHSSDPLRNFGICGQSVCGRPETQSLDLRTIRETEVVMNERHMEKKEADALSTLIVRTP